MKRAWQFINRLIRASRRLINNLASQFQGLILIRSWRKRGRRGNTLLPSPRYSCHVNRGRIIEEQATPLGISPILAFDLAELAAYSLALRCNQRQRGRRFTRNVVVRGQEWRGEIIIGNFCQINHLSRPWSVIPRGERPGVGGNSCAFKSLSSSFSSFPLTHGIRSVSNYF